MYLDKFSKIEQDEIRMFYSINKEDINSIDINEIINKRFEKMINTINKLKMRENKKGYLLKSNLDAIRHFLFFSSENVMNTGIVERFINNDVDFEMAAFYVSNRLKYLYNISSSRDGSSYIFDLLKALALSDYKLVEKYMVAFKGTSSEGHPFSKLFCETLKIIINNDLYKHCEYIKAIDDYNKKSLSQYDFALLDSVKAILVKSAEQLDSSLEIMLKQNKKKYSDDGIVKYFCINAHGIINLARHYMKDEFKDFSLGYKHTSWDEEFFNTTSDISFDIYNCNLEKISQKLAAWIKELPTEILLEELLNCI